MDSRLREALGLLAAALVSVAAAVAYTWPVVDHLNDVVMGAGELGGWLWRYDWHFRSLDALAASDQGFFSGWRSFVGLGRYPETGNILDVLAISYPLQQWFGFPMSYNLKVLLILSLNGVSAYALGRYFSGSIAAALGACVIAVVNPLCTLEIQACGLRQAVLWWVMLYPPLLDRALRRRTLGAGFMAGACFAMAGAFYWFYGLFTGIFSAVWIIKHLVVEWRRLDRRGTVRGLLGVGLGTMLLVGPFILPYALSDNPNSHSSATAALPEMTFFLPFPAYDTIAHAPLRPSNYAENIHASLHRTIGSSWSATYPVDPTLNESLPMAVFFLGIIPAIVRRRAWAWTLVWTVFYLGTLGPFLRVGEGDAENVARVFDEYVIRMPYAYMFQFIPGMARMFAPYRLGSYVMVASVALVAVGLARTPWRAWLAPAVMVITVLQPMLRLGKGAVNEGDSQLREFRSPFKMTRVTIPEFYTTELDSSQYGGVVELPLDQQQDIVCYYQTAHLWKVYKSWASPGSIPPFARKKDSAGDAGKRLRFQANPDVVEGPVPNLWQQLSTQPDTADYGPLGTDDLNTWAQQGRYQWVVLHERGYLLVDPSRGFFLYETAKNELAKRLGAPLEYQEAVRGDPANAEFGVPTEGELIPWSSQPLKLPPGGMPDTYRMAAFKLPVTFEGDYEEKEGVTVGGPAPAPPGAPGGAGSTAGKPTPAPPGAPGGSGAAPGTPGGAAGATTPAPDGATAAPDGAAAPAPEGATAAPNGAAAPAPDAAAPETKPTPDKE